jgi:hypothetical protein
MLFFNSPTLLLAGSLASALAQTGYGHGSNNETKPGGNDSLANAPYSTCWFLEFYSYHSMAVADVFLRSILLPKSSFASLKTCQAR